MRNARRVQSSAVGAPRRESAPSADSSKYLARGRVQFLTVSEGGRSLTIMVGPLRGPEHLELIRRAQFYHVPVSAIAASRTSVAYIAFYEGASRFHARTGVIREYAPVLRVSRARRCDLPGLTWPARGAPDAPYYRFDLGPIQQLVRPITNPGRLRVAFRFPDFERLGEATTLAEMGPRAATDRKTEGREKRPGGENPRHVRGHMGRDGGLPAELRARVNLTKNEVAHLWNGGILSLKVEGPGVEADLELRCPEAASDRGTRILIKRVTVE